MLAILAVVGQSPEMQARVDRATAEARTAVLLSPADVDAYRRLASIYVEHKFLRAASSVLSSAVALVPQDGEAYRELGRLHARARNAPAAVDALRIATRLHPGSADAHAALVGQLQAESRLAEAEFTARDLVRLDPMVGGKKLYHILLAEGRKLEAAVAFKSAKTLLAGIAGKPLGRTGAWTSFVDDLAASKSTREPKCLARHCIQGLEAALEGTAAGLHAPILEAPHDAGIIHDLLRSHHPTLLRGAVADWAPVRLWDERHLSEVAGQELLEVTVVEHDGAFEVFPDRIERPPQSEMLLGDFVRLLSLKVDANLTVYSRQVRPIDARGAAYQCRD
jgi:tetratricopeptide (TPR) repeat protein